MPDIAKVLHGVHRPTRPVLCLVVDGPAVSAALVAGTKIVWSEERREGTPAASLAAVLDNKVVRKIHKVSVAVERCPVSVERIPMRDHSQIFPTMATPVLSISLLDATSAIVAAIEQEQLDGLRRRLGQDVPVVASLTLPREDGLWLQIGWSGATLVSVVGGKTVAARHLQTTDAPSSLASLEREVGSEALRQAMSKSLSGDDLVAPLVAGFCTALAHGVAMSYATWSRDGRASQRDVRLSGAGSTLVGIANALGTEGFAVRPPSERLGRLPLSEASKWQDAVALAKLRAEDPSFPVPTKGSKRDWGSVARRLAIPVGAVVAVCAVTLAPVVIGSLDVGSASASEHAAQAKLARLAPESAIYDRVSTLKKIEPGLLATRAHIPSLMATLAGTLPAGAKFLSSTWTNGGGAVTVAVSVSMPATTPYRAVAAWHSKIQALKGVTSVTMSTFSTASGTISTSATVVFAGGAR